MKDCPFCAEQIQDEAVKCRYCGEALDTDAARWRIYRKKFDALRPDERARAVAQLTPSQQEYLKSSGAAATPLIPAAPAPAPTPVASSSPDTQSKGDLLWYLKGLGIALGLLVVLAVLLRVLGPIFEPRSTPQTKQVERSKTTPPVTPPSSSKPEVPVTTKEFTFTVQGGHEITATTGTDAGGKSVIVFTPFMERTDGNLYNAALHSLWNIYGKKRGLFQLEQAQLRPEPSLGGNALCWPLMNPPAEFCVFPTKDEASGRIGAITVWVK